MSWLISDPASAVTELPPWQFDQGFGPTIGSLGNNMYGGPTLSHAFPSGEREDRIRVVLPIPTELITHKGVVICMAIVIDSSVVENMCSQISYKPVYRFRGHSEVADYTLKTLSNVNHGNKSSITDIHFYY